MPRKKLSPIEQGIEKAGKVILAALGILFLLVLLWECAGPKAEAAGLPVGVGCYEEN